jgi:tetratricopeptide (TPR) repeat protein
LSDLKGVIVHKEFIDFGTNRTYALNQAIRWTNKTFPDRKMYLLFLDADMVLKVGPKFDKNLISDQYQLLQGNDSFQYYNTRLISTKMKVVVKCPTHEYYDIQTPGSTVSKVDKDFLFIEDIGDGGSKSDKYQRDIRLLLKGLESEPKNGRYLFYLANSYYDSGDYLNAIKYYKQLLEVGSWIEEEFYSCLRLGFCYKNIHDEANMVAIWMEGYNRLPERVETLYELIKHYRWKGKHQLCAMLYDTAKHIEFPSNCSLFIHNDIYQYLLLEEFTIFGYYTGRRDLSNEMFTLMKKKPMNTVYSLFNNYKFYQPVLKATQTICLNASIPEFEKEIYGETYRFIASSPSILKNPLGEGYCLNVRCVNYRINPNGSYPYYKHITTLNKKVLLSNTLNVTSITDLDMHTQDRQYVGVEDIKLYTINGDIHYTGTGLLESGNLGILTGQWESNTTTHELKYSKQIDCEKNWVVIPGDRIEMIYKWYPLTVGTIENNEFIEKYTTKMPQLFSLARGSTNGFRYNDEIWFVVHFVHQNDNEPRHYYHSIVVFDGFMELLKYTRPLKFTNKEIEYCLGIVVEDTRVLLSHSVWDRESYLRVYDKEYINLFFEECR